MVNEIIEHVQVLATFTPSFSFLYLESIYQFILTCADADVAAAAAAAWHIHPTWGYDHLSYLMKREEEIKNKMSAPYGWSGVVQ